MATHALVCLVGFHGTGKTSIARHLVKDAGFQHLSVGDLGRLARRGRVPSNVPSTLMVLLARTTPGSILDDLTAEHLVAHLFTLRATGPVVVDGFPACPGHVKFLDDRCFVAHITLSEQERNDRLLERGKQTVRQWTPGGSSARDQALEATLQAIKHALTVMPVPLETFSNDGPNAADTASSIADWSDFVCLGRIGARFVPSRADEQKKSHPSARKGGLGGEVFQKSGV